jgi:hypothetical protein
MSKGGVWAARKKVVAVKGVEKPDVPKVIVAPKPTVVIKAKEANDSA